MFREGELTSLRKGKGLPSLQPESWTACKSKANRVSPRKRNHFFFFVEQIDMNIKTLTALLLSASVQYARPDLPSTIWMSQVHCVGTESTLDTCKFPSWGIHECIHKEDSGVCCTINTDQPLIPPELSGNQSDHYFLERGSMRVFSKSTSLRTLDVICGRVEVSFTNRLVAMTTIESSFVLT
jgi:hypothetical protein